MRAVIDKVGKVPGSAGPLGLRAPFNWLAVAPQRLILRFAKDSSRLNPTRRLVANG